MSEDMYAENILDHYRHPRNKGSLINYTHRLSDVNPLCGDKLNFDLLVEGDKVRDVKFDGVGCAISQASASILSEYVKGKSVSKVKELSDSDLLELLGVKITPARLKCALLSLKILKKF